MEFLTIVYLFYTFLASYFLSLFVLIYFQNRKEMYESPPIAKEHSLSIIIPCYNAEAQIGETIQRLLDSDYNGLKKIIVVDDCSEDNSYNVAKEYQKKYPKKVLVVRTPENTGRAAGSKNYGAKFVKTDLIGFTDDDSRPLKDAISKMIGFFDDLNTGGVTSRVLVQNRKSFISRLQSIEYKVIAFTRKLLGFVGGIYVTNGPLSIYRKSAYDEVHGFDIKNLTEDIEITWHLISKGYMIHMALPAKVYTITPDNLKDWYKQRIRWNVGGIQTINKYKRAFVNTGMLGYFIIPFFVFSWFIAITGFGILVYRVVKYVIVKYLSTKLSIEAQTAVLTFRNINLNPSVLFLFGVVLLFLGLMFNLLALSYSKEKDFKKHGIHGLFMYMFVYLTLYPSLLIMSIIAYLKGKNTW